MQKKSQFIRFHFSRKLFALTCTQTHSLSCEWLLSALLTEPCCNFQQDVVHYTRTRSRRMVKISHLEKLLVEEKYLGNQNCKIFLLFSRLFVKCIKGYITSGTIFINLCLEERLKRAEEFINQFYQKTRELTKAFCLNMYTKTSIMLSFLSSAQCKLAGIWILSQSTFFHKRILHNFLFLFLVFFFFFDIHFIFKLFLFSRSIHICS